MTDEQVYQYPPELMQLLVQTIPLISRTKKDVLLLFIGSGMTEADASPVSTLLERNAESVNKYSMTRDLLAIMNSGGDRLLRPRRELLRRVTQFEDFSACWPDDQLKAKGLVGEVRRVVNVKDSFTRMAEERERERSRHQASFEARQAELAQRSVKLRAIRKDFLDLFAERDPQRRGRRLEPVVNRLFDHYGMLVRESFERKAEPSGRVLEQIDGVIELDDHIYLVEMKWLKGSVSIEDVSRHLVRVYHRAGARGLFISDTQFSEGALEACTEALRERVVTLMSIEEIVRVLERESDLRSLLRRKVERAVVDKRPWVKLLPK